jgi:hypothetical protein
VAVGLVDHLELCVLVIGRADVVIYANRAAQAHFQLAPPFAVHRSVIELARTARASDEPIDAEVHKRSWLGQLRLWGLGDGLVAVTLRPAPPPVSAREVADALRVEVPEARLALRVSEGYTNRGIADKLDLPIGTINSRLSRLYQKLGVKNRAELATKIANAMHELEAAESPSQSGRFIVMHPTPTEG